MSNYPIERMDEIQVLEPGEGRYRPMSELEDENKKLDKYRYVAEHQGGSYGSVEPIIYGCGKRQMLIRSCIIRLMMSFIS